jgi:hypothetical protein
MAEAQQQLLGGAGAQQVIPPRRRYEIKFEARPQRESEKFEDYVDNYENYCVAVDIDEDEQVRLVNTLLNVSSRRRLRMIDREILTWRDVRVHLLRQGSTEERNQARRRLNQRTWGPKEELMDFTSDCWSLARKAWPGDRRGAEAMAIDAFVGIPLGT